MIPVPRRSFSPIVRKPVTAPSGTQPTRGPLTSGAAAHYAAVLAWLGHLPKTWNTIAQASATSALPPGAVRAFQTNYNAEQRGSNSHHFQPTHIDEDGVFGPATRQALDNYAASAGRAMPPYLIPGLSGTQYAALQAGRDVPSPATGVEMTAIGGPVQGSATDRADKTRIGSKASPTDDFGSGGASVASIEPQKQPRQIPPSHQVVTPAAPTTTPETSSSFPVGPVVAAGAGLAVIAAVVLLKKSKKPVSNPRKRR